MFYKEKFYSLINWKNRPNLSTPLGAKNLNKMDKAIGELDERVVETSKEAEKNKLNVQNLSSEVESVSKDIEEVRTETNSSIDALKIVPTASGNTVYIDDASNMNIENIDFFGESKQETTTGKNKLPFPYYSALPYTTQGVTFTDAKNGVVNVNGTSTGDAYVDLYNSQSEMLTTESVIFSKDAVNSITLFYFERIDGKWSTGQNTTESQTEIKITPSANATGQIFRITLQSGKTANNITVKPMIRLASNTDSTWEKYTGGKASPSPDYPQPIESKIVNRVDVTNAQLLDLIANTNQATTNGMVISVESGYILTVNGTSSKAWSNLTEFAELSIPSGKYTFSVDAVPSGLNGIGIKFRKSIEDSTNVTHVITGSKKSITLDYSDDFKLVQIYADGCNTSTNYNFTIKVMLNAGETALPFEQHQSQTVNLSAPIELNGFGGVRDTSKLKKFGVVVFDGSDDEGWATMDTATGGVRRLFTRRILAKASASNSSIPNILCTHYKPTTPGDTYNKFEGITVSMQPSDGGNTYMYIYDERFNTEDISLWKAHLQANPMTVVYELADPIETALPQVDIDAIKALHSYKPNTVVMNDANAEMDVHYVSDSKLYIDRKFEALASAIVNQ